MLQTQLCSYPSPLFLWYLIRYQVCPVHNEYMMKGICPKGNNKIVIILFYVYDRYLFFML
jgi:hypothetical protein